MSHIVFTYHNNFTPNYLHYHCSLELPWLLYSADSLSFVSNTNVFWHSSAAMQPPDSMQGRLFCLHLQLLLQHNVLQPRVRSFNVDTGISSIVIRSGLIEPCSSYFHPLSIVSGSTATLFNAFLYMIHWKFVLIICKSKLSPVGCRVLFDICFLQNSSYLRLSMLSKFALPQYKAMAN